MMFKKDEFFDWLVPKRSGREKLTHDLKVIFKTNTVRVNVAFSKPYLRNGVPRLAFVLKEGERPICVPDPREGVPFYQFKPLSGKNSSSYVMQNSDLAQQLGKLFGKKNGTEVMEFDLKFFEKMSGMSLYEMIPVTMA